MTLSNRITLIRILLTPLIFIIFFYLVIKEYASMAGLIALWILFISAEVSDLLDGFLARKRNEVSDIGKLLDPFADVVLRLTFFFCFTYMNIMPPWAFIVILYRELAILIIRMLVLMKGIAMGARKGGKLKSILYFSSSLLGLGYVTLPKLLMINENLMHLLSIAVYFFFSLAAVASLVSLFDYLFFINRQLKTGQMKNKEISN